MQTTSNPYRCHACGAFSYRKLTRRGPDGSMGYGEQYSCSGCGFMFVDPAQWRTGPASDSANAARAGLHTPVCTLNGVPLVGGGLREP